MKKGILIFMIVFLVLIILAGIIFIVVGNYFFDFALSANSSKAMVLDNNQGNDEKENTEAVKQISGLLLYMDMQVKEKICLVILKSFMIWDIMF